MMTFQSNIFHRPTDLGQPFGPCSVPIYTGSPLSYHNIILVLLSYIHVLNFDIQTISGVLLEVLEMVHHLYIKI